MGEYIKSAVEKAKNEIKKHKNDLTVNDDRAFSYALLYNYFELSDFGDQDDCVTDGSNDGGIDFVYFDDNELKVIVCQSKYTQSLSYEDIGNELDKIYSTIANFKRGNTGAYNERLKRALRMH